MRESIPAVGFNSYGPSPPAPASSELEHLRNLLAQVKATKTTYQKQITLLSAEAWRLERQIKRLVDDDDASEIASEDEFEQCSLVSAQPSREVQVQCQHLPSAKARDLPSTSCLYSCFQAGHPVWKTVINDVVMMPCHWRRSCVVTQLSTHNLASESEASHLRKYCPGIMEQQPVVNFMVWRRSVLLMLVLASFSAFCFSAFGDNWAALRHMREMEESSYFEVSFLQWQENVKAQLPSVACAKIDAHFAGVLASWRKHRLSAGPENCATLLSKGVQCTDIVQKVVPACWEPRFCRSYIRDHCPAACDRKLLCRDTRDAAAFDFPAFTAKFAESMLYMLLHQLSKAELMKAVCTTATKLVACLLMVRAAVAWADWRYSRRLVLIACLLTFCTPFVRSVVPTPILISWGPIDRSLEAFFRVTEQHYDLTNRMTEVAHLAGLKCNNNHAEEQLRSKWDATHHHVEWWCDKVAWGAKYFPWSGNLERGSQQCELLTAYMGLGTTAAPVVQVEKQKLCASFNQTLQRQEPLGTLREVVDVDTVRSVWYAIIGGMSGLLSFRAVFPEALSVAPGLMKAAIRIKIVAPQSYLPGVFIALMPLLYVPTLWSFCIFVVQCVGDLTLLLAFVLLAFAPLVYTMWGVRRRVTYPMSVKNVVHFTTTVEYCSTFMQLAAFACLCVYATKVAKWVSHILERQKGISAYLLEKVRQMILPLLMGDLDSLEAIVCSGPMWSLICSFVTAVYMTIVFGADWMIHSAAEEWNTQGQECLVELQEQGMFDGGSVEAQHQQREEAMKAMVELTIETARSDGH